MSHSRHHSVSLLDVINRLPTRQDFDSAVNVLQERIDTDSNIGIVQMNGSIYAVKHIKTPTMMDQREVLEEYQLVRDLKLLGYHQIYNDTHSNSMIIVQDYLPCNLFQYIITKNKHKKSKKSKKRSSKKRSSKKRRSNAKRITPMHPTLIQPSFCRLKEFESKHIALCILYKLRKMHKNGYIHADVKLQNIMKLTSLNQKKNKFGEWKLIDFSLRIAYNISKGYAMDSWRGTIGWTSPELVPNNGYKNHIYPETDVWGMGLVILYMVLGQNPFELTVDECKSNKLYNLQSGKKYWYSQKLMAFGRGKKWNHYLMFLHKKNKISLDLLDLLLNHMLVFDVKKRSNVKTVLKHKWFREVIKMKKINSRKKLM